MAAKNDEASKDNGTGLLSTNNEKLKVPFGAVNVPVGAEPRNVPEELTV